MEATKLDIIPTELLSEICSYLNAQEVLYLWLTSKTTRRLLSVGGVREIIMPRLNRPGFPRFIKELSLLTSLVIHQRCERSAGITHIDLLSIPSCLRRLELSFAEAISIFFPSQEFLQSVHDPKKSDPRSKFYTKESVDIAELLPCLGQLSLEGDEAPSSMSSLIATIPASLTHLEVFTSSKASWKLDKPLPPHLRKLIACPMGHSAMAISSNSSLTELDLGVFLPDLSILPRTLEIFSWVVDSSRQDPTEIRMFTRLADLTISAQGRLSHFVENFSDSLLQAISPLPLTLLTMEARVAFKSSSLLHLPRSIESLKIRCVADKFDTSHYAFLPRPLTSLSMSLAFFPIGALRYAPNADPNLSLLPPGLTKLNCHLLDPLTEETIALLPRSLTKISNQIESISSPSCLPPSLLSLTIRPQLADVTAFPETFFQGLPPHLTSLSIVNCDLKNNDVPFLPSRLTRIIMPSARFITDEIIRFLPRSTLELDLSSSDLITDKGLSQLPPTLRILIIKGNQDVTDEVVGKLPRTLKAIQIRFADWSDACAAYLPPQLQHLTLGDGRRFTDQGCRSMPRTLTLVHLRLNKLLTIACLKLLPNTLLTLRLPSNINFHKSMAQLLPKELILWTKRLRNDVD